MRIVILGLLISISMEAWCQLLAFPEAEGYGAIATGGRNGKIIKVTNLDAEGPGSLQAACAEKGPRIVVFDVAGVIFGDVVIKHPFITIAGQTAPSPGITIAGRLVAKSDSGERLNDIIVRFLRIRPPPYKGYAGDALQMGKADRVMLDHLSMSWANDETIDIIHTSNITVQWSTIEESDPFGHGKGVPHNHGILSTYPGSGNVSIHHNLFAHHSRRTPSLTPYEEGMPGDFVNNIVYNFKNALVHDGHIPRSAVQLVSNYYKRGPNSSNIRLFQFNPVGRYVITGNYLDSYGHITINDIRTHNFPDWVGEAGNAGELVENHAIENIRIDEAIVAYTRVLKQSGAFPRDRVTKRTIEEVEQGTGSWGRHATGSPTSDWFLAEIPIENSKRDSDNDGMPDQWELSNGLNPGNADDAHKILDSDYPAIEQYLNELVYNKLKITGSESQ